MKVRDLQKSHDYRESVRKWGEPTTRKRIHYAGSARLRYCEKEHDFKCKVEEVKEKGRHKAEIESFDKERNDLKSWVKKRKELRKQMNSLGLNSNWLANKSNKTDCEQRVYNRLNDSKKREESPEEEEISKVSDKPRLSAAHVEMLPFLNSPLPIALAMIADYLQENRLRLLDLFKKVDKNKDWKMTKDELKISLKQTRIPLTDMQLDELIFTVDVDNDDQISYKELARGIELYHRDRRWQKLKKMYDNIVDNDVHDRRHRRASIAERKAVVDLLLLPRLESSREQRQKASRDSIFSRSDKLSEISERSSWKSKKTVNSPISTLGCDLGRRKVKYIAFLNKECERLMDLLESENNDIDSEMFASVLLPPNDNTCQRCKLYLSSALSMYPRQHSLSRRYEKQRKKKLKKLMADGSSIMNTNYLTNETDRYIRTDLDLPRVATIDFKDRAEEGRKLRNRIQTASPTLCWPQHLLDKLCLCMDNEKVCKGEQAVFNFVKR